METKSSCSFIELRENILKERQNLSPKLRQIADYALGNPDDMAVETIAIIAERAHVQPSALIRFSHYFGFRGFSHMQQLYKERLLRGGLNYNERIRILSSKIEDNNNSGIIDDFVQGSIEALQSLTSDINLSVFEEAIHLLYKAETIWLSGVRRCYPVATYFNYAFSQLGKKNIILDGTGHMSKIHSQNIGKNDTILALSFKDYAQEVQDIIQKGKHNGAHIVSITDSAFSPLVNLSDVALEIHEVEVHAFRSLSTSMCLALSIVVALGNRMREPIEEEFNNDQ